MMNPSPPPERPESKADSASQRRQQNNASSSLWRLSGMGFQLASEVLAGALIGWLLDKWLGTSPVFLLIGSILGISIGMISFIRQALRTSPPPSRRRPPDQS